MVRKLIFDDKNRPELSLIKSIGGISKSRIENSVLVEERNELFFSISSKCKPLHVFCTKSFSRESLIDDLEIYIRALRLFQNKSILLILAGKGTIFYFEIETRNIVRKTQLYNSDFDIVNFSNSMSQSLVFFRNPKSFPVSFNLKTFQTKLIPCRLFKKLNCQFQMLLSNSKTSIAILGKFADLQCAISLQRNFKFKFLKTQSPLFEMLTAQGLRKDKQMLFVGSKNSDITITDTRSWKVLKSFKHEQNRRIRKFKSKHGLVYGMTSNNIFVFRDRFPFDLLCFYFVGSWISEINMSWEFIFFGTGDTGRSYFLKNVFRELLIKEKPTKRFRL